MADALKNFAVSAVATAPSPASSGTSLVVTTGHGTRFPAVPFNAVVCPANTAPDPSNAEIVRVTAISTDTFTITRAQESSSARSIIVGDQIFAAGTIKALVDATKSLVQFTPLNNQPPASNFATLDTRNTTSPIAVLDFDDTTQESAVFAFVMPESAILGSGLIVRIMWMATSATSGDVRWGVQFERCNTDLDSDSFDTAATGTSTTNGTSGIATTTAITITTIDSIAAGDLCRLKVYRDAANGGDTMSGDAEVISVEVRSAA